MVVKLRHASLFLFTALTLLPHHVLAADPPSKHVSKTIPVPGHGDLILTVPEGWDLSWQHQPSGPPLIFARKLGSKETGISITVMPAARNAKDSPAQRAKSVLEARAKNLLPQLQETTLDYKELNGQDATGYYCLVTYKKPEKGRGPHGTLATVAVGDLLLSSEIAQKFTTGPYQQAALHMLKTSTQKPTAKPPATAPTTTPTTRPITPRSP